MDRSDRFDKLTPSVDLSEAKTWRVRWLESYEVNSAVARFCLKFAVDSILKMKKFNHPNDHYDENQYSEYRVVEDTPIIVYPAEKRKSETIQTASAGETILVLNRDWLEHVKFVPVIQDDEPAYIARADIEAC